MQWKKNKWALAIAFFIGVLICFITTRYEYFEIKKELDIPNLIMGVLGLLIGFLIADTIQKRLNKNQNQYIYLENKLDACWTKFSNLAKTIHIDDKVDLDVLSGFTSEIVHQLDFIKNIFSSYELNNSSIVSLEKKLEELDELFDELETENNIKFFGKKKNLIEGKILEINKSFSKNLSIIQNIFQ